MLKMWNRLLFIGAASAVVGLAACGGTTTASAPAGGTPAAAAVGVAGANLGAATVKISATGQLSFDPAMQAAHVGDIIQWTNTGSVEHTVSFDSQPSLSDPSLQPGGTWEIKFTTAGTYTYHCDIHPSMVGTVVVS
jgi:plastocyanin